MVVALRRALVVRGAVAFALGLSLVLASLGAGSSASAEEPASVFPGAVFYGYVFADSSGTLPERVRALGPAGAVCGSAAVTPVAESAGFYVVYVVSDAVKRGCPPRNGIVQFSLLTGRLDEGIWAEQVATLVPGETPQFLNLRAQANILPNWSGTPGNVEGGSLLHWTGARSTVAVALSALPFPAGDAYRLDIQSGTFVLASADDMIESGELLLVRSR